MRTRSDDGRGDEAVISVQEQRSGWSLKWRLIALFAAFALVEIATATVTQVVNAREFIEEEMKAAIDQAVLLAVHVMEHNSQSAQDYADALGSTADQLRSTPIRHIRLEILDRSGATVLVTQPDENHWIPPGWFIALLDTGPMEWRQNGSLGTFIISGDPQVEIAESWENMVTVTGLALALNIAMMLLVYGLVTRLIRPLHSFEAGLKRLEQGSYDFSPDPGNIPELMRISDSLTSLRDSLRRLTGENFLLAKRLITVQDEERHSLAHEIHDGLGPYIFSIRVDAQSLIATAPDAENDVAARGTAILQAADRIQTMTRAMLKRLRPMALDHMQVAEVLTDMVETWRRQMPDMDWHLSLSDGLAGLDESTNVTRYHTVKDAGLNVIRHADAATVWISVTRLPSSQRGPMDLIEVQVSDDGTGVGADRTDGIGLAGMRERVRALGGVISIGPRPGGGTKVLAGIPVSAKPQNGLNHHD